MMYKHYDRANCIIVCRFCPIMRADLWITCINPIKIGNLIVVWFNLYKQIKFYSSELCNYKLNDCVIRCIEVWKCCNQVFLNVFIFFVIYIANLAMCESKITTDVCYYSLYHVLIIHILSFCWFVVCDNHRLQLAR